MKEQIETILKDFCGPAGSNYKYKNIYLRTHDYPHIEFCLSIWKKDSDRIHDCFKSIHGKLVLALSIL